MTKLKKTGLLFSALFALFISLILIHINYPHLRTDLFRSVAEGNWFITSEKDTLYTMGYYGVRKYQIEDHNIVLLHENKNFCKNRMIGRGGCVYDKFVYVTSRSFLTGKETIGDHKGKLIILNKSDLSIIKEIDKDIKLVEGEIYDHYLITSGLGGFDIYNLDDPTNPTITFSYRHKTYREYHGIDLMIKNDRTFVCFALFSNGIEIWEITDIVHPKLVCNIPIRDSLFDGEILPSRSQVFHVLANYPYIFAPLGITSKAKDPNLDKLGLLVFDVSNFQNVKLNICSIPSKEWYNKSTGDMQPTYIAQFNDAIYLNFAEKGVAVFDINEALKPCYLGLIDISGKGALIQPIHVTDKGKLFTGSYYWTTVYGRYIDKN